MMTYMEHQQRNKLIPSVPSNDRVDMTYRFDDEALKMKLKSWQEAKKVEVMPLKTGGNKLWCQRGVKDMWVGN